MSEFLSSAEFDERRESGRLALSLVGMSNVGKSYISNQLAGINFNRISCDEVIGEFLQTELANLGLSQSLDDVAEWMGLPHEARSAARQARYLELEAKSVQTALKQSALMSGRETHNFVIDTTGSVVHLDREHQEAIRENSLVVYIAAPPSYYKDLIKMFISNPKPVIWGDSYQLPILDKKANEQSIAQVRNLALMEAYPKLLRTRERKYRDLAHVTLDRCTLEGVDGNGFLDAVSGAIIGSGIKVV